MKIKLYFLIVTALVFVFLSGFFVSPAFASTFSGWIWGGSEDGTAPGPAVFGWISMNCANDGSCATSGDYKVNVDDATGNLSGYGWSGGGDSNEGGYGWIDFGSKCGTDYQASSCSPDASIGCSSVGVKKNGNSLTGCARVVGIAQESFNGNSGGWDGWIKFDKYGTDSYGWNGETPASAPNVAYGLGGTLVMPGPKLKICRISCDSPQYRDPLPVWNINMDETISLKACLNSSDKCDDPTGDFTGDADWSDAYGSGDLLRNAVNSEGSKGNYKAVGAGKNEDVTAKYSGDEAKVTIYVNCVHDPNSCTSNDPGVVALRKVTCKNAYFPDNCGNGTGCQCTEGDCKDCTGWWEGSP